MAGGEGAGWGKAGAVLVASMDWRDGSGVEGTKSYDGREVRSSLFWFHEEERQK